MASALYPHTNRIRAFIISCLVLFSVLNISCMGRPKVPYPEIPHEQALGMNVPMKMQIVRVYDGMKYSQDPHTSHLIICRILEENTDLSGEQFAFPYDEWATGTPPPQVGRTLTIAPAAWVRTDPRSMGKPR